jgi:hypothetical protein
MVTILLAIPNLTIFILKQGPLKWYFYTSEGTLRLSQGCQELVTIMLTLISGFAKRISETIPAGCDRMAGVQVISHTASILQGTSALGNA